MSYDFTRLPYMQNVYECSEWKEQQILVFRYMNQIVTMVSISKGLDFMGSL